MYKRVVLHTNFKNFVFRRTGLKLLWRFTPSTRIIHCVSDLPLDPLLHISMTITFWFRRNIPCFGTSMVSLANFTKYAETSHTFFTSKYLCLLKETSINNTTYGFLSKLSTSWWSGQQSVIFHCITAIIAKERKQWPSNRWIH